MTNPLLAPVALPLFDQIQPEHVSPAMDALLARAETALAEVTQDSFAANWTDISRVLDVATENLSRTWGAVSHLNSVADTPELRAAYNAALPRVTEFWTRLGADERLYAKYKAINVSNLNPEQRQAHKNAVRNFVLSGAELKGQDRVRFAEIQERQAELSQKPGYREFLARAAIVLAGGTPPASTAGSADPVTDEDRRGNTAVPPADPVATMLSSVAGVILPEPDQAAAETEEQDEAPDWGEPALEDVFDFTVTSRLTLRSRSCCRTGPAAPSGCRRGQPRTTWQPLPPTLHRASGRSPCTGAAGRVLVAGGPSRPRRRD